MAIMLTILFILCTIQHFCGLIKCFGEMAVAADKGDGTKFVAAIIVMLGIIALLVLTIISATNPLGGLAFVMGIILAVFRGIGILNIFTGHPFRGLYDLALMVLLIVGLVLA